MGKTDELRAARMPFYGDPYVSHSAIGYAWGGLLTQAGLCPCGTAVPPHIVAAMLAAMKLVRSATQNADHRQDSYDDAAVYTIFSDEFHPRRTK